MSVLSNYFSLNSFFSPQFCFFSLSTIFKSLHLRIWHQISENIPRHFQLHFILFIFFIPCILSSNRTCLHSRCVSRFLYLQITTNNYYYVIVYYRMACGMQPAYKFQSNSVSNTMMKFNIYNRTQIDRDSVARTIQMKLFSLHFCLNLIKMFTIVFYSFYMKLIHWLMRGKANTVHWFLNK